MATSFPPTRTHSTTRVSLPQAHSLLAAYLSAAATDSSLHPNALLTESGSSVPSSGSGIGLVLHNLHRVEAGLRGEYLGADLSLEKNISMPENGAMEGAGGEGAFDETTKMNEMLGLSGKGRTGEGAVELDPDWQSRSEFEREQDVVQGEIGEREYGGPDGVAVPRVKKKKTTGDKEARKVAKVGRRKAENKARAEQARREREAEES